MTPQTHLKAVENGQQKSIHSIVFEAVNARCEQTPRGTMPASQSAASSGVATKRKVFRPPSKRKKQGRWFKRLMLLGLVGVALSAGAAVAFELRPDWLQTFKVAVGLTKKKKTSPAKAAAPTRHSVATRLFERAVVPLVRDYVRATHALPITDTDPPVSKADMPVAVTRARPPLSTTRSETTRHPRPDRGHARLLLANIPFPCPPLGV